MSELAVGSLKGLAANSFVIDIAAGSTLNVPPPAILQVVQTVKTDVFTASGTTGTRFAVPGLTASITPSSTSSKILVMVNITNGNQMGGGVFITGGVSLPTGDSAGSRQLANGGLSTVGVRAPTGPGVVLLDTPNTTSLLTYGIEVTSGFTDTRIILINRPSDDTDASNTYRTPSSITLMEVAG